MKTKLYTAIAILSMAFGMTACSSSDDLENGGGNSEQEATPNYLAITVRSVGTAPLSRANTNISADSPYENGTDTENNISKIRFYFFDGTGQAFDLANSGATGGNWIERTSSQFESSTTTTGGNIEKTVLVDLISNTRNAIPSGVIAVINPESLPSGVLQNSMSVQQLRSSSLLTTQYANSSIADFVMTNSAYENNGTNTCASLISSANISTSQAGAKQNPVDIYVERIASKIRVKHGSNTNWTTIDGNAAYPVGTTSEGQIYAEIIGWGIADENGEACVTKNIGTSADWTNWSNTDTGLGFTPWSTRDYKRSFWEITPVPNISGTSGGNILKNHTFTELVNNGTIDDSNNHFAYTLPNTPTTATDVDANTKNKSQTAKTKLIIAAQLKKANGDGTYSNAELCEYKGQRYVSISDVKKAILRENTDIWYTTSASPTTRSQLTEDDLSFITFSTDPTVYSYQVKAKLDESATNGYTFYTSETGTTTITADDLNTRLGGTAVNVRLEGRTYYYTPIRHMAEDPAYIGYYGVVRNHLYDITINTIGGFGTPVYDPGKTIIPIIPTDESSYLSARINVLSWRVVSQSVDLNATE